MEAPVRRKAEGWNGASLLEQFEAALFRSAHPALESGLEIIVPREVKPAVDEVKGELD